MKQVLQNLKTGATDVANVPCPAVPDGGVLIRTSRTLISAGTERMLLDFGKAGLISKARQQPDKVRQVLQKMQTDGIQPTLDAVRNKLDAPLPLGYSNVGRIMEVGTNARGFSLGDRVLSNGKHAEVVAVPQNLCAKIPDEVSDEAAAFAVIGAIALQGIRLIAPTLGETVVVSGLGLIGLMAVQLLRANGCRVIGSDFDADRLAMARQFGAETIDLSRGVDPVRAAIELNNGQEVDAVLVTASTKSSDPITQAAHMCRKRGRIVLVGVTGLTLSRADFYEKELSFQVSCSYGPGRYDPAYEEKGLDYPIGFVRWTERRNFEAILDLMKQGLLDVAPLISHRFTIADAPKAYDVIGGTEPSLGVVLEFASEADQPEADLRQTMFSLPGVDPIRSDGPPAIGLIGAGNYAGSVLAPAFQKAGAQLGTIVSSSGVTGYHIGKKFGFAKTGTDIDTVLADKDTHAVVIATRHDTHADLTRRALEAGKHVFVEKPLALRLDEVAALEACVSELSGKGRMPQLMVGFNRRFAPQIGAITKLLGSVVEPKSLVMTVNAGAIPDDHWTQDRSIGGGRIVGEGCHFVDLLRHLVGHPIESYHTISMASAQRDSVSIGLRFLDGSIGTVHYLANGHKGISKERLEIFAGGRAVQLDNFRKLTSHGWSGKSDGRSRRQDKGQTHCIAAFLNAIATGVPAIPLSEIFEIARVSIDMQTQVDASG